MSDTQTEKPCLRCLCGGTDLWRVFSYDTPPPGEIRFRFSSIGPYQREVWRCDMCGHFMSVHDLDSEALYTHQYVTSTYGDDGLRRAFERIISLDPSRSDNARRVQRILEFAATHLSAPSKENRRPTVLDVGSGLCVFLYRMKAAGWDCTALDPDKCAVIHAHDMVGIKAVCGDFMAADGLGCFDLVTFNKVLEHVKDPVTMLAKSAQHLYDGGLVYVEVPDGEAAVIEGPGREEFFIEHHHAFSLASLALMVACAGFSVRLIERLREPSMKYTLRAFLVPKPCCEPPPE